ncbi:hypothetical protein [Aureimonas pseudogalii]|uniref:Uncharacterized protein n=1 Tax=Aureimonas pseudogalii TaxID=1744844 RepID=A0A7W6EDN8_9HYPH|nr:hypothetical protein [Aureimonas pseudogalii]MBB3997422.1 hypothetical protein [Aureimonas pseudogalii]
MAIDGPVMVLPRRSVKRAARLSAWLNAVMTGAGPSRDRGNLRWCGDPLRAASVSTRTPIFGSGFLSTVRPVFTLRNEEGRARLLFSGSPG